MLPGFGSINNLILIIMKTKIEKTIEGYKNAQIMQDDQYYYIDLRSGLGESLFPKSSYSLEEAIKDTTYWEIKYWNNN